MAQRTVLRISAEVVGRTSLFAREGQEALRAAARLGPVNVPEDTKATEAQGVPRAASTPSDGAGLVCGTCQLSFGDAKQQREHFRSDWHRYNIRRRVRGSPPVPEADFEQIIENGSVSSISGTDSASEAEDAADAPAVEGSAGSPRVYFGDGRTPVEAEAQPPVLSVYRALFPDPTAANEDSADALQQLQKLPAQVAHMAVFLCGGGHFAGAIFNGAQLSAHKTFHRYTVRRKQGAAQSQRDAQSGGHRIKSAGATLRRYNERALEEDIRELLTTWKDSLAECALVFMQMPLYHRTIFFGGKTPAFDKGDRRVRTVPFITRRPTLKEAERIHGELTTIFVHRPAEVVVVEQPEKTAEAKKEVAPARPAVPVVPSGPPFSALHVACESGNASNVREALQASPQSLNEPAGDWMETPLHVAARTGCAEAITMLLEGGADPTLRDARLRPPYVAAGDKETRNAFRRYMAAHADAWDYAAAQVPSALTKEMEDKREKEREDKERERADKERLKKQQQKARQKEKHKAEEEQRKRDEEEKAKQEAAMAVERNMSERERRARAAEARLGLPAAGAPRPAGPTVNCVHCGVAVETRASFERMGERFCSTKCVQATIK